MKKHFIALGLFAVVSFSMVGCTIASTAEENMTYKKPVLNTISSIDDSHELIINLNN